MDEAKRQVLHTVGYRIGPSCGQCVHFNAPGRHEWGTCRLHLYLHGKHTDREREVSVHTSGFCPDFDRHPSSVAELAAHAEYLT